MSAAGTMEGLSRTFTWELPGIMDLRDGETRMSEPFYSSKYGAEWALEYKHAADDICKSEILLILVSSDTLNFQFKCKYEITWGEKKYAGRKKTSVIKKLGKKWLIKTLDMKSSDLFTMKMEVTVFEKDVPSQSITKVSRKRPGTCLLDDIGRLLDGKKGDLTLSVARKKLKVHKLIVGARSKKLAAMLVEDMVLDELKIHDVDYETMKLVVNYMYTDQVDDIETNAGKLYPVACRYELLDLKAMCEETLESSLTVENAVGTLVFVHQNSKDFKTRVVNFMKTNYVKIIRTVAFQSALENHRELCIEVIAPVDNETLVENQVS